jgi:putative transposase
MTVQTIALIEYLRKLGVEADTGVFRESVRLLSQSLMKAEAAEQIGASKHERTPERVTRRSGYRDRLWETRVGEIPLQIPKLREASNRRA